MQRRDFFKKAITVAGSTVVGTAATETSQTINTVHPVDDRKVSEVAFPQKRPLITYSDRPPLLETPREVFTTALTPNDLFFVRWHMPMIPTYINPNTFSITIDGEVENPLKLSLETLKSEFKPVEITSVLQCGGNNRSAFHPTPGGIQWGVGAMGCARWKGVKLKDVLARSGPKKGASWIKFHGLEKPVYTKTDGFIRALELHKVHDEIIIAYEMNGEALPYLNGYPVRLILPGFYSDSWIKMLSNITITSSKPELHFMDHAYRMPDNECECETPENPVAKTKPIEEMNVNSLIGYPVSGTKIKSAAELVVRGIAFDGGHGIKKVEISTDGGGSWKEAKLDDGTQGPYAYRTFTYAFTPQNSGSLAILSRATNIKGETQPFTHEVKWNRGGYKFNGIDEVTVEVVA
jgi:sulfoxide reductase catalytic subunit YedY